MDSFKDAMRRAFVAAVVLMLASSTTFAAEIDVKSVLAAMNDARQLNALPPLAIDDRLTAAAEDRMRDMEDQSYWDHRRPDGLSPFVWLKQRGYDYALAGENLAAGFETAEILVEAWLESPGHRANILSAGYTEIGIAVIEGSVFGRATGKSIVVMFGREQVRITAK